MLNSKSLSNNSRKFAMALRKVNFDDVINYVKKDHLLIFFYNINK